MLSGCINWFSVFSEMPPGISGRKNCKEAILCSGRLRFAALPAQKSLLGPAKLALRIKDWRGVPLQTTRILLVSSVTAS
jgi:hypothetical protein